MLPNQIPFEEKEYSPLRVKVYPVISVTQTAHKYLTRQKNCRKKCYNTVVPALIAYHAQPTPIEILDHQYRNILANSVIYDITGEFIYYRDLIKCDKHKNTWEKSFANMLGRLAQRVVYRVKGTHTFNLLVCEHIPTQRWKYITYSQLFCNQRLQKDKPHRTRLVAGDNLISFPSDVSTRTIYINRKNTLQKHHLHKTFIISLLWH